MVRMENNIKVGLVQQSVGTEIANNTQKLVANIRDCAQR